MSTEHSQALPRSVVLLRLLRRILSVTAVACAAAGMIASADALISGFGDGGDKLSVAADNSTVITGSLLQVPSLRSRVIAVFKYVSNRPKTASPHLISA